MTKLMLPLLVLIVALVAVWYTRQQAPQGSVLEIMRAYDQADPNTVFDENGQCEPVYTKDPAPEGCEEFVWVGSGDKNLRLYLCETPSQPTEEK